MKKEKFKIYYKDSIKTWGKGITRVEQEWEPGEWITVSFEKFVEYLIESIGADLPSFYDDEVSIYIGNATAWTYDILFDAQPEIDLDKYQDWFDENFDIKFINEEETEYPF